MCNHEDWKQVAAWLREAGSAVAFTGAGISTESGIPDFRSPGGVWSKTQPVLYDDFLASAEARREYWRQKCEAHGDFAAAGPNTGHRVLAGWEQSGLLWGVITQNIDGLHQEAGSRNVLEEAAKRSRECRVFLAIGLSLVVEPAAGLPRLAHAAGARLVILNRDPTGQDDLADLVLHESIGKTLEGIDRCVGGG